MITKKTIALLSLITSSLVAKEGILLDFANIRTEPSSKAEILKVGAKGDVFHILQEVKNNNITWFYTKRGYLFAKSVRILSDEEVELRNSTLSHEDIIIYEKPTTDSLEVGVILKGSKIDILEVKNIKGSHYLWYKTKEGWIYSPYINAVIPIKTDIIPMAIQEEAVPEQPKVEEVVQITSRFKEGVAAYDNQEYKKAVECFGDSKSDYTDAEMQLYWAKSEEKLHRRNHAIAAYERVVVLEPQNLEATMKLVELYKLNLEDEHAQEVASNFDDKDLSPEQRTALAQLLTTNYAKLDKLSAKVATKIGYDSNIASTAGENSLNSFALALSLTPQQRAKLNSSQGTMFSQTLASVSYIHDLTHKGGWFAQASADAMLQFNSDASLYNTKYIKGSVALGYKISNTTITLPLYYAHTHYLDKNLLKNYGVEPSLSSILSSKYILNIGMKLNEKNYIPSSMKEYDSQGYGINSSLYYLFGSNYVSAKVSYDITSAINESNTVYPPKYVDKEVVSLFLTSLYRFKNDYLLKANYKLSYSIYNDNYYAKNSLGNYYFKDSKREDTYHNLGLSFSKYIYKTLKATADYRYSKNSTDYYLSDYDKHILSVGLEYNY